jgi:ketosteroid isomerase-like protein
MSQENVELVRRAYGAFDTDLARLLRMLDPAIEWVSPPHALEPGSRHGHQGVREAFAATAMAWDRTTHTLEGLVDANDKVLATVRFRGHGHGSGMDADRSGFYQLAEALEAAGLRE